MSRYTVLASDADRLSAGAIVDASDHHAAAEIVALRSKPTRAVTYTIRATGNGQGERFYRWEPRDETLTRLERATR